MMKIISVQDFLKGEVFGPRCGWVKHKWGGIVAIVDKRDRLLDFHRKCVVCGQVQGLRPQMEPYDPTNHVWTDISPNSTYDKL